MDFLWAGVLPIQNSSYFYSKNYLLAKQKLVLPCKKRLRGGRGEGGDYTVSDKIHKVEFDWHPSRYTCCQHVLKRYVVQKHLFWRFLTKCLCWKSLTGGSAFPHVYFVSVNWDPFILFKLFSMGVIGLLKCSTLEMCTLFQMFSTNVFTTL